MANDSQIQQDVLAALEREISISADAIGVEVHHGVVKLAGKVSVRCDQGKRIDMRPPCTRVISVVPDIDVRSAANRFEI